jgi:deoxyribodipyrimidine photo-lyase
MLRGMGIAVHTEPDAAIVEPGAIVSGAGTPYTVFTPFARTWRAYLAANPPDAPAPAPPFAPVPEALAGEPIPTTSALGMIVDQGPLPAGGEAAGYGRLAEFAAPDGPIAAYHTRRDLPAEAGTSHLSAYLRFGCVAPAAALRAAEHAATIPDAAAGAQQWIGELAWRDFYLQIVQHFPHVLRGAFRQQYDAIAWENDELLFAAWCAGRTGYPIVDAAMRQLQREAWMHNRCRMIVASFLTKDLLIDWRWGEQFFMQNLVDGDPAANNGGWQWAAGTGTDAQPYFRIFNPTSQGRKFDPQGAYVRRYVPELRRVPVRYIHEPWKMPATEQQRAQLQIGRDYPAPIVDHAQRRLAALEMYRAVR